MSARIGMTFHVGRNFPVVVDRYEMRPDSDHQFTPRPPTPSIYSRRVGLKQSVGYYSESDTSVAKLTLRNANATQSRSRSYMYVDPREMTLVGRRELNK